MKHTLIALSYAGCWGIGLTLTKLALNDFSETTLLLIQLLSSVLVLSGLCYLTDRRLPLSVCHLRRGVAGIFEPALAYMVSILGLPLTTATNASLIGSTEVIFTLLAATLFLGEPLTLTQLGLAIVSFGGVFLGMGGGSPAQIAGAGVGDLLILLGTLFAVVYVLLSKAQVRSSQPLQLVCAQQWVGLMVTVVGFGLLSLVNPTYEISRGAAPLQAWLLAIASGVMQYALAFLLYLMALRSVPVSHAAFYVACIPIFGITSAIVLIHEQTTPLQWLGIALVVLSSYGANRLQPANN